MYTTTIITSKNLVHKMLSFSSSYPDLTKLPHLRTSLKEGMIGGEKTPERQGEERHDDFKENSIMNKT
jgi:hypothetical protein